MANKLRAFLKKSPLLKKLKWDFEYMTGTWKFLDSSMEEGRYQNIISLMSKHCPPSPSILEVGCGEGILLTRLKDFVPGSYTGVDFSDVAIRRAISKHAARGVFEVGNMNSWTTGKKFDVIIFNESIYYSDDPVANMARYSGWLTPGGHIIVSIFIMAPTQIVLDKILAAYKPQEEMEAYRKEMGYWRQYIFSFH